MNEQYGQGTPNGNGQRGAYGQQGAPGRPGVNGQRPGANRPGPGGHYGGGPAPGAAQAEPPPGVVVAGPLLNEFQPPYRRRSAGVVVVQMYNNGGHSVLWPSRPRQDHNRPMLRQPYAVYEVAVGRHVTDFWMRLPAIGDAEFFDAEASVHWWVEDPVQVVEAQAREVAPLLRDELKNRLRYVSRRFRLTEAQFADEAVQTELGSGGGELGAHLGLRTKVYVRIDLSERVREQVREGDGLDRQMDIAEREYRLQRRREQQQSELVRERARAFEELLARGDESRIAYFMAKDPQHALEIEQHFAGARRQDKKDMTGLLTHLIDSGHIERDQIQEGVYEVLQHLRRTGRTIGRTVSGALPGEPSDLGELEGRTSARRQPFWEADDADGASVGDSDGDPELEAARGEGPASGEGERAVRDEDPWDEGPSVYEPSSVESAEERDRRTRDDGDFGGPRRGGRASDRFDDWGD